MTDETGMFKRFLMAFGLVVAYLAAWAPPFLVWVLVWRDRNEAVLVIGILAATAILLAGFIPYLNFVARRVFYFAGQGEPASEDTLRGIIMGINRLDVPVRVEQRRNKLIITWKYADAKWWELMSKAGLKQVYELHLKFNNARKEVTAIDILKSVSWRAGPTQVSIRAKGFRGLSVGYELGAQWGIKETYELGTIYKYRFSPGEIKNPVVNSILRNGWAVRFGIW